MKNTLLALLGSTLVFAPVAGTAQVQSVVDGNTRFALDLYSQLATNSGNLFFSPYSISTSLAMLYAGASGNTELQMSQVLGFGTNQQEFASLFGQLQAELRTDQATNAIELNIANALWLQEGFPFLPAFLQTATNQYQANLGQADFLTQATEVTDEINNWVAQETQNKIQNILAPGAINASTRLVLANAIYFLGAWTTSFEETNTSTQPFYLSSTTLVQVPLMHQPLIALKDGRPVLFDYMQSYPIGSTPLSSNDFQAIELPYGSNQLSMVILLPSQINGLGRLEQQLSPAFLSDVLRQMRSQQVQIFLPKFTLESSVNLRNTLAAMGMSDAFAPFVADFSGIDGRQDLFVSFVLHKAWGQVNEAGTQAAAATVIGVVGTTATNFPPVPPVFRADHPFLFLIRDTQTGSVLFLGRLTNPSPSGEAGIPALTVSPSVGGLRIAWPSALSGLALQQSADLTRWTSVGGVSSDGTNYCVTKAVLPSGNLFFRLAPQ